MNVVTEPHADSLSSMVNWWRVDGHGDIIRLVGL